MGFYQRQILPRMLDLCMRGRSLGAWRQRCVGQASGRVLEIGFGSGLNLSHYPAAVEELLALEPSPVALRLAGGRVARAPFPVRLLAEAAEVLPLEEDSVDCVLSTFTLCTLRDPAAALREIRRVLTPAGCFLFLEHGRSPDPGVARWQDRLNPIQKRVGGGCHLNREIDALVRAGGFELEELECAYLPHAPRFAGHLFLGRTRPQEPSA